jgi:hypothetical protein
MAQIIKHRRGSLESVSSATKRAGELLVVTGSAGITATNGNSILFVGIDGSTVTPANKILQGTATPDLTGATYDTSIDGIPFYNTSQEKLFIVNKGGNVEVKATANTGGTGIVSGSSQVAALLPTGTISSSAQVNADSITNFDSNVKAKLDADGVISGSTGIIPLLPTGTVSGSSQISYASISSIPAGIVSGSSQVTFSGISSLPTLVSGSSQIDADSITNFDSNVKAKLDADGVISGSAGIIPLLPTGTVSGSSQVNADSITNFDTNVKEKLNADTVVSGSSQVVGILSALNTFSSSQESKDSTLATYTASVDTSLSAINSYTSSLKAAFTASGVNVTFNGDTTVKGNLFVQGTQTVVDSTTINLADNILVLNAAGTSDGGLVVRDATGGSTTSGSLLWDVTNDYWKAGALGAESKLLRQNGDSVVSGSAQITISSTTGYSDYSSSVATAISASTAAATWTNLNGKPGGIVSGSSQIVANLSGSNLNLAGISGSSLNITGNAKIDGNLTLGGNITIGDATTDTVSFAADLTSDIIPSGSNVRSLGSASRLFANVYATNVYGAINATNGVVSGSSQILGGSGLFSSSAQVNADSITNFDTNVKEKLNLDTVVSGSSQITYASISSIPAGIVSGSSQLDSTTINLATLTNVSASGSFSGSHFGTFSGDGSNLTGIASTLAFSGSTGNDTLNLKTEALLVTGSNSISAAVTGNTITITADNASTSAKGVASFSSTNFGVTSGNVAIKAGGVNAATLNADLAGTGLSLDGGDNSLKVDYGSTSGTAVEGNTSLTVQGTANEIEITGGSVTLGSGGTVTIGLPDNVTISGSLTANGNVYLGNSTADSVTIAGNLYVQGTTTTVDSTTVQIGDNIIELNGSGAANGGLLVRDVTGGSTTSGSLLWDTTNDYWKAGAAGSEKEVARFSASPTSGSVQVVGASGLFVNSQISDDAVKVTIGTDLVITGLTANSFVVSNGSKKLISVTPSNAGDLIQWNGSSFIASNELDGGTF